MSKPQRLTLHEDPQCVGTFSLGCSHLDPHVPVFITHPEWTVNAANAAQKVKETVWEKVALLLMQCSQNRMKMLRALMLIRAGAKLAFDCISET